MMLNQDNLSVYKLHYFGTYMIFEHMQICMDGVPKENCRAQHAGLDTSSLVKELEKKKTVYYDHRRFLPREHSLIKSLEFNSKVEKRMNQPYYHGRMLLTN